MAGEFGEAEVCDLEWSGNNQPYLQLALHILSVSLSYTLILFHSSLHSSLLVCNCSPRAVW